ncbi:hypothetical protein AB0D04_24440 [Streptomyces sp. NPDC048483]|uniref:hypothetical protein n=1 Tax=Streptomyces sp. NPDC048483 TaxID=3154927 RepID=UPI003423D697
MHCLSFTEPGPPRLSTLPNGTPVWMVSRHRDVWQVLTDPRFTRSLLYAPDAPPLAPTANRGDPALLFNQDSPEHHRLRRTVQRAFTHGPSNAGAHPTKSTAGATPRSGGTPPGGNGKDYRTVVVKLSDYGDQQDEQETFDVLHAIAQSG